MTFKINSSRKHVEEQAKHISDKTYLNGVAK